MPWLAAPHYHGMCKGRQLVNQENQSKLSDNIYYVTEHIQALKIVDQFKACLKPCLELHSQSKLRSRFKLNKFDPFHRTVLSFSPSVKKTRYKRAYDMFDLVVEVGSCLGLWIGLSALGLFDLMQQSGEVAMKKLWKF